jgi:hypothetical protein
MADTDKVLGCQEGNEMVDLMLTEMTKQVGTTFRQALFSLAFAFAACLDL